MGEYYRFTPENTTSTPDVSGLAYERAAALAVGEGLPPYELIASRTTANIIWHGEDAVAVVALDHMDTTNQEDATKQAIAKPTTWPGDFARYDQDVRVAMLNDTIKLYLSKVGEALTKAEEAEKNRLEKEVQDYRAQVRERHPYAVSESIKARYAQADAASEGAPMLDRVVARVNQFNSFAAVLDADGTITDPSKESRLPHSIHRRPPGSGHKPNYLTELIPGSEVAEPMLETAEGRNAFSKAFVKVWQPLLRDIPVGYYDAGTLAPLRDGVPEFFEYAHKEGDKIIMLTANFELTGRGILSQIPHTQGIPVIGITENSIIATAKEIVLFDKAHEEPNKALIYIGDGASDLPALKVKEYIACYFALDGSVLANALQKQGIPHFTYKNFHDVIHTKKQIKTRLAQLREQAA